MSRSGLGAFPRKNEGKTGNLTCSAPLARPRLGLASVVSNLNTRRRRNTQLHEDTVETRRNRHAEDRREAAPDTESSPPSWLVVVGVAVLKETHPHCPSAKKSPTPKTQSKETSDRHL